MGQWLELFLYRGSHVSQAAAALDCQLKMA